MPCSHANESSRFSAIGASRLLRAPLLAGMVVWHLLSHPALAQQSPGNASVVQTENGLLRGKAAPPYRAFLGIPYAQPPLGEWRWRSPQPVSSWSGQRDATRLNAACPQPAHALTHAIKERNEDCLYLNVYTPASAQAGDALPVIVWFHGGAFMTGSATEYGAEELAETGKVVVVTVNYRLGVLGFMALPELRKEDPRMNFGLQDQVAALKWVQRNIGQFGGNAAKVTAAGESAGGQSVLIHLVSPHTKGLFHRAIVQSAAPTGLFNAPFTLEQASVTGNGFANGANCPEGPDRLTCLRAKPVDALVNAVPYSTDFRKAGGGVVPVIDGDLYPEHVFDGIKAGRFHKLPVLIGMTRDELQALVALAYQLNEGRRPTEEEYQNSLSSFGTPPEAAKLLTGMYPSSRYDSPQNALSALFTDFLFQCPNNRAVKVLAKQVPTFAYRFDDRHAPSILNQPGLELAYHASELRYLFDIWTDRPLNAEQQALATRMKKYWANFAATGDPNRSLAGTDKALPDWPRFNWVTSSYKVLNTDDGKRTLSFGALPSQHKCLFWDVIESFLPKPTVSN
jgi:para-nitrobenzyl esterase